MITELRLSPLTTLSLIFKIDSSAKSLSTTPATVGRACIKETPADIKVDKVLVNLETIILLFKTPIIGSFYLRLLIALLPLGVFL